MNKDTLEYQLEFPPILFFAGLTSPEKRLDKGNPWLRQSPTKGLLRGRYVMIAYYLPNVLVRVTSYVGVRIFLTPPQKVVLSGFVPTPKR